MVVTAVLHAALALIVYVCTALAFVAALRALGLSVRKGSDGAVSVRAAALGFAANLAAASAVAALWCALEGRPLVAIGFSFGARAAAVAGAGVVAAVVVGAAAAVLFGGAVAPGVERGRGAVVVVVGLAALAAAAFAEELLFRGYLLSVLRALGTPTAVALSTGAFVAVHFLTTRASAGQVASWIVGGLLLAVVFLHTGSLAAATAVHLARNVANAMFLDPVPGLARVRLRAPLSPWQRAAAHAAHAVVVAVAVAVSSGGH